MRQIVVRLVFGPNVPVGAHVAHDRSASVTKR